MGTKVFIPVSDELMFDRPELISAPLRPYTENLACYHWLDVRINPQNDSKELASSIGAKKTAHRRNEFPHTVAA